MDKNILKELLDRSEKKLDEYIAAQFKSTYYSLAKLIAENHTSGLIGTVIKNEEDIILINFFKKLKGKAKQEIISVLTESGLKTDEAENLWYVADYDVKRPQFILLSDKLNFSELNSIPKDCNSLSPAKKTSNGLKTYDYVILGGSAALIIAGVAIPMPSTIKISAITIGSIGTACEILNYVSKKKSTPKAKENNRQGNTSLNNNPAVKYCEQNIKDCYKVNVDLSSRWVREVITGIIQECEGKK